MTATIYPLRRPAWHPRARLANGGKKATPAESAHDDEPEATAADAGAADARELVEIARVVRKYGPHLWKATGAVVLTVLGAAWYVVGQVHDVDRRVASLETALQDHKNNHNHQWSPTDTEPVPGPNPPPSLLPSSTPSAAPSPPVTVNPKTESDPVQVPHAVPSSVPPKCVHSVFSPSVSVRRRRRRLLRGSSGRRIQTGDTPKDSGEGTLTRRRPRSDLRREEENSSRRHFRHALILRSARCGA